MTCWIVLTSREDSTGFERCLPGSRLRRRVLDVSLPETAREPSSLDRALGAGVPSLEELLVGSPLEHPNVRELGHEIQRRRMAGEGPRGRVLTPGERRVHQDFEEPGAPVREWLEPPQQIRQPSARADLR